ncbi:hypothetical protein J5834_02010 [bacterium]|nr:hypothetical protein [bacterium]
MKVYKILGTKQQLIDKTQAVILSVSLFIGAALKSLTFLLLLPAAAFGATLFIREKFFSGKPEWGLLIIRRLNGGNIYYSRQYRDSAPFLRQKP